MIFEAFILGWMLNALVELLHKLFLLLLYVKCIMNHK